MHGPGYTIGDHTADLELRAWGRSRRELFINTARGMLDYICPETGGSAPVKKDFQLTAPNIEDLLIAWLNEILFFMETEEIRFQKFDINRLTDRELKATLKGAKIDWGESPNGSEIKAATYHNLSIRKVPRGWETYVILDL